MAIYDRQINSAKRMIAKYGQSCEWVINRQTPDEDRPYLDADGANEPQPIKMAFFTVDNQTRETLKHINNMEIPLGWTMGYMGAVDFEPSLKDTVDRGDGKPLRVFNIDILKPNGRPILYTVIFEG